MAHHKSAMKRIRRNVRQSAVNRNRKSRIHTFLRKINDALSIGDKEKASAALREAQPEIMRGAGSVMHQNTASRKVSRLSKRIKAL